MPRKTVNKRGEVYFVDSDESDESYDGFYFGDNHRKKPDTTNVRQWEDKDELYEALCDGDLEKFKQQVLLAKDFFVDNIINSETTPLLYACKHGFYDIVRYLLIDLKAQPNKQVDSITPLMAACDCITKDQKLIEKMIKLLLKLGADINTSDKFGTTAFMLACKNGYTEMVKIMLKDASFDCFDNSGCTPIFYAVQNNHADVVRVLMEAGVNANIPNKKGYKPRQVAQNNGFYDLLELLPREKEKYVVPSTYLGYNSLRDHIPRLFLKSDCPEYFQEINILLLSMRLDRFLEQFAKHRISLAEFLCINEKRLEEIGIEYPIHRMKFMKALLDFHLHHWSASSIIKINKTGKNNFYQILMMSANNLQNLVVLSSSLKYIEYNLQNNLMGSLSMDQLTRLKYVLNDYKATVKVISKTMQYISSFSPPQNVYYIDYKEYLKERKQKKYKSIFKFTTVVLSITVIVGLKVTKAF